MDDVFPTPPRIAEPFTPVVIATRRGEAVVWVAARWTASNRIARVNVQLAGVLLCDTSSVARALRVVKAIGE